MFITTKRKPDWTATEFRDFLVDYPIIDTSAKFKEYEDFAKDGFESKFTMRWLAATLRKIDEIYYADQLLPFISQEYGKLHIKGFVDEIQTAGFVVENEEHIELCLNQKLFVDLFQEEGKSYHAGGLICDDVFSCVSQVLLHECIHLALSVCEKMGVYDDSRHHGKVFARIAKRMLSHCSTQHGLVQDLVHTESLCNIRNSLKVSQPILVFFKFRFVPAVVEKIFRKKVEVRINGKNYIVHLGLVKLLTE